MDCKTIMFIQMMQWSSVNNKNKSVKWWITDQIVSCTKFIQGLCFLFRFWNSAFPASISTCIAVRTLKQDKIHNSYNDFKFMLNFKQH